MDAPDIRPAGVYRYIFDFTPSPTFFILNFKRNLNFEKKILPDIWYPASPDNRHPAKSVSGASLKSSR
jgi:hypothetical protein